MPSLPDEEVTESPCDRLRDTGEEGEKGGERRVMLGAIIGDIVGSRWEFNPTNDYDFELFSKECSFTDDTVCTIAVADALMRKVDFGDSLHAWCRRYPNPMGGYGERFAKWVMSDKPTPYGSFGNGSAMRVSPVAWLCPSESQLLRKAEQSSSCTHNHPDGIRGAQAVALAIYRCRKLHAKRHPMRAEDIKEGLTDALALGGYDIDAIRREDVENRFDETAKGTVPVAFWIIMQSESFEDALRKAVSLGADADTLGAIVCSVAEVIWGIPEWMKKAALAYLPKEMRDVLNKFRTRAREGWKDGCRTGVAEQAEGDEEEPIDTDWEVPKGWGKHLNMQMPMMFWKLALGNVSKILQGKDGMPKKEKVAKASDWNVKPMPEGDDVSVEKLDIPVSEEQMAILRFGHIPEEQEDHWMMVCEEGWIRYYRSWTGICAFEAHYHQEGELYKIDELRINKALAEFGVTGDLPAIFLFRYLLTAEIGGDGFGAWEEYLDKLAHLP